jgi:carbamoyl-phosphate synthase large subunit
VNLFNSVLVTGCGGDIGQGICRILKMSNSAWKVFGCDIHEDHIGPLLFDSCERIVRADDKKYFQSIRKILRKYAVDLIIPMSEAEIGQFVEHGYFASFEDTPVLLANEEAVRVGLDKLETVNFLRTHGLEYPWTEVVKNAHPRQVPCVVKMRWGQGSKNFVKLTDERLVPFFKDTRPEDLWQELLLPENEEYTCGLYRTKRKEIRTIVIRRKLQGGLTGSGTVVRSGPISKYLEKIAESLNLQGSINVQLRCTNRGPVAFEINPRFSSTVVFRHLLGFQDLIWSLCELKDMPLGPYQEVKEDIRIYRGVCEYIVEEK